MSEHIPAHVPEGPDLTGAARATVGYRRHHRQGGSGRRVHREDDLRNHHHRRRAGDSFAFNGYPTVANSGGDLSPPDYKDRHLELGLPKGLIRSGDRVLAVDDLIDSGGQLMALQRLIAEIGATWVGASVLTRLLYDGSVKAGNATAILNETDVDGVLVGGASLDAAEFSNIAGFERQLAG